MEGKASDWRPGPTVCRCCLTEGCYKDISTEYFWMGKREVYSEMLKETLDVSIGFSKSGGPNSNSRLICEPCISRLRDASEFKRQVMDCEKTFMHHLDPGTSSSSSSKAQELAADTIGEVKMELVKHEKESLSDDDFDDRPDFLDVDSDDDLDDQPLTKLATKIPKKESVSLLDLLDTSQITVKRKSTLKLKTPPKKIVKKKEVVKPSASKAAPVKQTEKKKDEEWTTTDTSGEVNKNSTPQDDEWITTDSKDTTWTEIKVSICSGNQASVSKQNDIVDDEWTISDTTKPFELKKLSSDQSYMEQNVPSDGEWDITDINKTPAIALAKDKQPQRTVSVNHAPNDHMIWAQVGQKWVKIVMHDDNRKTRETGKNKYKIACAERNESKDKKIKSKDKKIKTKDKKIKTKDKKIKTKDKAVKKKRQMKESNGYCLPNARLMLQYTTAIPIRIQLHNIDVTCFACEGKFKDPFEFRDHFLAEHKDVDKTKGMHLYNTLQTRVDITDLACLLCEQSFGTLEEAAQHLIQKHEINIDMEQNLSLVPLKFHQKGLLICWICKKKCASFRDLYRHAGSHFTYHICEICGQGFEHKRSLISHLFLKHKNGHKCYVCKGVFSTALELKEHSGGCHSIKCKICKEAFGYHVALRKHQEAVHGFPKRIYKCLECEKVAETRMQLYLHTKREHTDDYKCGTCNKKFGEAKGLRLHMLVHTGERPFKCHICQQAFKNPSYHKTHVSKCKI